MFQSQTGGNSASREMMNTNRKESFNFFTSSPVPGRDLSLPPWVRWMLFSQILSSLDPVLVSVGAVLTLVPVSVDDQEGRQQGRRFTSLLFWPTPELMQWWTAGQASGCGLKGQKNGWLVHYDDDDDVYVPGQSSLGWASGCSCPTTAASAVVLRLHCNQWAWVSVRVLNQSLLHLLVTKFPHI